MATDLSHLPQRPARVLGHAADENPRFVTALADAWFRKYMDDGNDSRAHAVEGTRFRASWAGLCSRALYYRMTGTEETQPMTIADAWRFGLGTMVHDGLEDSLRAAFPGAECEVKVDLRPVGLDGSAHIDAVLRADGWTTVLELKTINGFGMKCAVGARGDAEGPRASAVLQGALTAYALDADELVVGYLSLENMAPRELQKFGTKDERMRFAAEWTFTRDQFRPLAEAEIARVNGVIADVDSKTLPLRIIPDLPAGAVVHDAWKGAWVARDASGNVTDAGTTWNCGYCGYRSRCQKDGPGGTITADDE